jgi:hypothetical protein
MFLMPMKTFTNDSVQEKRHARAPREHNVCPDRESRERRRSTGQKFMRLPERVAKQSKADWSWGCVATVDSNGRTIFVADAHRGHGKRFVVRADEKLTAFLELELVIRA